MDKRRRQETRKPSLPPSQDQKSRPVTSPSNADVKQAVVSDNVKPRLNGHTNGGTNRGGVGPNHGHIPRRAHGDPNKTAPNTLKGSFQPKSTRQPDLPRDRVVSQPPPKNAELPHSLQEADDQIKRNQICTNPPTSPLSVKGESFATSHGSTYPDLFKFLQSSSPLDFNGKQMMYAAQMAISRGQSKQQCETLIQKAVLLLHWESHTEDDAKIFFEHVHDREGHHYEKFISRSGEIAKLIKTERGPSQAAREETRHRKVDREAQKFFTIGTVFGFAEQKRSRHGDVDGTGKGLRTFVRRMVVIKESHDSSLCLPISTYGGRGVPPKPKTSVDDDHSIIFGSGLRVPDRLHRYGEPEMSKKPIAVDLKDGETLERSCRLCFHMPQVIKHNIRVAKIGSVAEGSKEDLGRYFREVMTNAS